MFWRQNISECTSSTCLELCLPDLPDLFNFFVSLICNIFQQTSTINQQPSHRSEVWVWCLHCLDWPPWASRCQCWTLCIWSADAHHLKFQYDPLTITDHHWPSLTITDHHWPSLTITDHHWPSLSLTIIQHHSASLTMEYHERKWFFPWPFFPWHHGFRSPLFLHNFARCGFLLSAYGMTRPGSLSFGDSEHSHGAAGKCSANCSGKARSLLILFYFVF